MKKIVKSYDEDGVKYRFNDKKLQMYTNQLKSDLQIHGKQKKNKSDIQKELADKLFVSEDAVKNWMYGYNAPQDLEQVKRIADYFSIDYHRLLDKEEKEMAANSVVSIATGMANETQIQYTKEKVRGVYLTVLGIVNDLMEYYYTVRDPSEMSREQYMEYSNEEFGKVFMEFEETAEMLEKLLLDIPETLYSEIKEYLWTTAHSVLDDIYDVYDQRIKIKDDQEFYNMDISELEKRVDLFRTGYIDDFRRIFADFIVK